MSDTATATRPSAITWFEIPTADFDRARRFYETILGTALREEPFGPARIAMFPYEEPGVTGCLDEASPSRPSADGTVVFLKVADGELDGVLARVQAAGGSIAAPKTELPGIGWVARIDDSEGNRVGLHAIS
jgi:predicted enzyme related to lactoylglutathione lyase